MYYVYVLLSRNNGDVYIGYTHDLRKRFLEHNNGIVRATKDNIPWVLVYYETYRSKKDATMRERQLKNHRAKKDLKIQIKNSLME